MSLAAPADSPACVAQVKPAENHIAGKEKTNATADHQNKALSSTAPELEAWSIDGGGGRSTAGSVVLIGAAGQPDVGSLEAGSLNLVGGLWSAPRGPLVFFDDFATGDLDRWSAAVVTSP